MPQTVFLTEKRPLLFKVADWLCGQSAAKPLDLSACAVLLPTAGAARRLRAELVHRARERGTGILPPRMGAPMTFLREAAGNRLATRSDSLLAWSKVFDSINPDSYLEVLGELAGREDASVRLAASFADLVSLLAEASLTPSSPEIPVAARLEDERWRQIARLHERYRSELSHADLSDPNDAMIACANDGSRLPGIDRVVVAGLPDITRLVRAWLESMSARGVEVIVLIDAPDCDDLQFGQWGRPDPESWSSHRLALEDGQIRVASDPDAEAAIITSVLGDSLPADIVVADSAITPSLKRSLQSLGVHAFDPEGDALANFEAAVIVKIWIDFCRHERLSDLRRLAECPLFLHALSHDAGLQPGETLEAIDDLLTWFLFEHLSDAKKYFTTTTEAPPPKVVAALDRILRAHDVLDQFSRLVPFLEFLYKGRRIPARSHEAEALESLLALLREVGESPLRSESHASDLLSSGLQKARLYPRREENSLDLNGWLEAPWLPEPTLIVSGCVEGVLPQSILGHPFVSDSLRAALGLQTNRDRATRDLYLLHCLLSSRRPGGVTATLSSTSLEGDPSRPSRLLFSCTDEALPSRIKLLFDPPPPSAQVPARTLPWLMEVPRNEKPVESLRVTAFGSYLQCPLRFYLQYRGRMEEFDPSKREMDAFEFGTILHKVVENFSLDEEARDLTNESAIEKFVLNELDTAVTRQYGTNLTLPVRVQKESLRARLRQFARIQAVERRDGWRIEHAEYRFSVEDTLEIAGIRITASIDRVEVHAATGRRRILDYKTYASAKTPEETHLAPLHEDPPVPESEIVWNGKPRRWMDLQLPLYRALARHVWPDDPEPPELAYFVLPARIEDSAILPLVLKDSEFDSAITCAEAVAKRIRAGIYWPPGRAVFDSFEPVFLGVEPQSLFTPQSIEFLKGQPR